MQRSGSCVPKRSSGEKRPTSEPCRTSASRHEALPGVSMRTIRRLSERMDAPPAKPHAEFSEFGHFSPNEGAAGPPSARHAPHPRRSHLAPSLRSARTLREPMRRCGIMRYKAREGGCEWRWEGSAWWTEHLRDKCILVVDDERDLASMVARHPARRGIRPRRCRVFGRGSARGPRRTPVRNRPDNLRKRGGLRPAPSNRITSSENSASCGRAASESAYQLFVLDVMMPGMDGFELLTHLRERSAYARVPVVFLTAKDEPFDRVSGLSLGADDYIAKPFLPQEIVLRANRGAASLLRRGEPLARAGRVPREPRHRGGAARR